MRDKKIESLEKENAALKLELKEQRNAFNKDLKWSQKIINSLANPVFIKDANHAFVTFNEAFAKMLNADPLTLIGKSDFDFTSPEESRVFWKKDSEVLENGITNWNEESHTIDGKKKSILTSKARIQDSEGQYFILGVITDITDNMNQQTLLLKKNFEIQEQKRHIQTLLKEVHHRVKNNLQIINSLLNLQLSKSSDPQLEKILENSKNRIYSMAKIHEILCEGDSLSAINLNEYIYALINNLIISANASERVYFKNEVSNILLNVETSIPMGMIINEIVTNSIKYGKNTACNFEIYVRFNKVKNNYILEVGDNGENADQSQFKPSLGSELISIFCEQLEGKMTIPVSKSGVHYRFLFPAHT